MNRILGQVMMWAGFIGAALATVRQVEVEGEPWKSVSWFAYTISILAGVVGVVLIRSTSSEEELHVDRVKGEFAILTASMKTLLNEVKELRIQLDSLGPRGVVKFIDDRCVVPFSNFADSRNALVQRFGLPAFANVMTQFASGERFVNRTWSAAADGYMQEAAESLARAERHLIQANQLILDLEK